VLRRVDPAHAPENVVTRSDERAQLQRDWMAGSAECDRQAEDALAKAAQVLTERIPGRAQTPSWRRSGLDRPKVGTLSHAEAVRSTAATAFSVDQGRVNSFSTWY
jgi:hypothetical protein